MRKSVKDKEEEKDELAKQFLLGAILYQIEKDNESKNKNDI